MEFQKDNTFFSGRLKSVTFAVKGAIKLITTEHSIMVQFSLGILMTIAWFLLQYHKNRMAFSNLGHWTCNEYRRIEYRHRKSSRFYSSQLSRENWIYKRHCGWSSIICCIYSHRNWINYLCTLNFYSK